MTGSTNSWVEEEVMELNYCQDSARGVVGGVWSQVVVMRSVNEGASSTWWRRTTCFVSLCRLLGSMTFKKNQANVLVI